MPAERIIWSVQRIENCISMSGRPAQHTIEYRLLSNGELQSKITSIYKQYNGFAPTTYRGAWILAQVNPRADIKDKLRRKGYAVLRD